MSEHRNLAARARTSMAFLQEQHCALRYLDGDPHLPTDTCPCGLAEASRVIVDLLESARELGQHALEAQRTALPPVQLGRYDRSYASPEEKRTGELLQAAIGDSEGPTETWHFTGDMPEVDPDAPMPEPPVEEAQEPIVEMANPSEEEPDGSLGWPSAVKEER